MFTFIPHNFSISYDIYAITQMIGGTMIPVTIETLVVNPSNAASLIMLRPFGEHKSSGRVLPIWIGPHEAMSIGMAIEGIKRDRPLTHDLIDMMMEALSLEIDHISITRVEESTFYADIHFVNDGEEFIIDARPSDSIALAIRRNAPIFVNEDVMDIASFPYILGKNKHKEEEEIKNFHEFIESVNPEDFSNPTEE
ncbi:MAG: bifunctional nuclease family protein [Coriobacteriia bacterium]|nr:bifunctional nuclease family protein [Coriobacteriia bacterium]